MRFTIETDDLPQSWKKKTLGECATVQTGIAKGRRVDPDEAVSVPYLRVANVQDGYLDLSEIKTIELRRSEVDRYRLQPGDVVLTEGGDLDKLGRGYVWSGEVPECVHQNHVFAVRVDRSELDPNFFSYQAQSPYGKRYFLSVAHKTTNLACINTTKLKSFPVLIPPLPEQKAITHTLSTVQRAIDAQERIIQTTTELKKALMQKLFTEGLRGEPQKETEIGLVPESWEVVPLGDIAKVGNGSTPKRNNSDYWEGGEIPWLNSSRIHDQFITEAEQFVTPLAVNECHLPIVSPDSLLIAITGQGKTLGNTAITRIRTCINQHLAYAEFHHPDIVPDFILWYMQTRYEHFRSIAHGGGSTKGALTCGFLKTIPIPVPPRREQSEISSAFHALDKKAHGSMAKQAVFRQLFQALLDQLITVKIKITNQEDQYDTRTN
jgi:type I restriction enzyme S subunit